MKRWEENCDMRLSSEVLGFSTGHLGVNASPKEHAQVTCDKDLTESRSVYQVAVPVAAHLGAVVLVVLRPKHCLPTQCANRDLRG